MYCAFQLYTCFYNFPLGIHFMLNKTVRYPSRCSWNGGELRDLEVTEHRWVMASELAFFDFLPADLPLIQRLQGNVLA